MTIMEKDGKILVNCKSGCDQQELFKEVTRQQVREPAQQQRRANEVEESNYIYHNNEGTEILKVSKLKSADGSKRFYQEHKCLEGNWAPGLTGKCGCPEPVSTLYRLPSLKTAAEEIYWVEGEKDVDALEQWGCIATCTSQGAGSFKKHLANNPNLLEPLTGKNITIIEDNDPVGKSYGMEVANALSLIANKISRVRFPSKHPGYDVSDFLESSNPAQLAPLKETIFEPGDLNRPVDNLPPHNTEGEVTTIGFAHENQIIEAEVSQIELKRGYAGHEVRCLVRLYEKNPETGRKIRILAPRRLNLVSASQVNQYRVDLEKGSGIKANWKNIINQIGNIIDETTTTPSQVINLKEVETTREEERWLVKDLIERGQHTMIYADGGTGKSLTALAIAASVSMNTPIIPDLYPITERWGYGSLETVLYLDWETTEQDHASRLKGMCTAEEVPDVYYQRMAYPLHQTIEEVRETVKSLAPALVIIDSVGAASGGDINTPEAGVMFINAVRTIGECAILSITHTPKFIEPGASQSRKKSEKPIGSNYFWNGPRSIYQVAGGTMTKGGKNMALFHRKANNGPLKPPIGYKAQFSQSTTVFSALDPMEDSTLREYALPRQVLEWALSYGERNIHELKDLLPEMKINSIESTLKYHTDRFKATGENWRLI